MSLTLTPFPMYDLPELGDAHDLFWRRLSEHMRRSGFAYDIALTQRCGYPLATTLRKRFDVVAAPVYDVPFSKGATHCGLIVVGADTSYATLEDLRGTRFALNAWDSNTGMNLPRRLVAPLAERGTFFRKVVETGSHVASLEAVRRGAADVASIDNVTFALLAEQRPVAVDGIRVLTTTAASPTLPFVIPSTPHQRVKALWYDSLAATIQELRRSDTCTSLRLIGVERASVFTYDPLLEFEHEAKSLGYGTLA